MAETKRDEKADYKAAYIAEYESQTAGGNDHAAELCAEVLRKHFDHEVAPKAAKKTAAKKPQSGHKERADQKAPENTLEEKPGHSKGDDNA